MTRSLWMAACLLLAQASVMANEAVIAEAQAPASFGNDHDDPRTADPRVMRAGTTPCVVEIVDHAFDSYAPATGTIDAPARCPGPWQQIVLELDGQVAGRQYDRIGHLEIGGVTVFRTSTPEPSREGITWQVEKDLSAYAALFRTAQPLALHVGNSVDDVHTGVFRIKARLLFYPKAQAPSDGGAGRPAADTAVPPADQVLPLAALAQDGAETVGRLQLPADAERVMLEVYATGSGGGCEEFWYFAIPEAHAAAQSPAYWCRSAKGPYREVQVLVDGRIAGVAAPYPHIYTGGWSNPFLWYVIPAPRAFDITPIRFELTPFIGLLNDGRPHEVRLRVLGVGAGNSGWTLMPNVQVWRDPSGQPTRGELLEARLSPLDYQAPISVDDAQHAHLQARASRQFVARGRLQSSRGVAETRVSRTLSFEQLHRWDAREDGDDWMRARWRETATVSVDRQGMPAEADTQTATFGLEGGINTVEVHGDPRLTTTLAIEDDLERRHERAGRPPASTRTRNRFDGAASYTQRVPREQRQATARSRQVHVTEDSDGQCRRHQLRSINGRFVEDREDTDCSLPASPPESGAP